MKKIKANNKTISDAFDRTVHKTERTAAALLMHWMRQIIETEKLDLGYADVETGSTDRKMPDLVIYENKRSDNVLCLIEAKQPFYDVFNEAELKEPARKKATKRKAKYFATTNFKKLIWFNTEKVNSLRAEEEQIVDKYNLSEIENLDDIETYKISEQIKKALKEFLIKLHSVHTGKEAEPKLALDELLIFRIQEKIRILSKYYKEMIDNQCHKDSKFANALKHWFTEQGWSFSWADDDFTRAARQTAYLLVNKILFYDLLQAKRPTDLDPLEIPQGHTRGSLIKSHLQAYFNEVLKIDYETIYTTDFIDEIAFPDQKEVVNEIKEFVSVLKKYDFSSLGFDVIGRIFERIIPEDERHILGQYFTNADVVDLILKFCVKHEDDKVLDPSCGAGTFLVRAYQQKKLMNQRKDHNEILDTLWGNDIAKFPAHLATINLAINDLSKTQNYPNILCEDFFALHVGNEGFDAENWRKRRAKTLGKDEKEITYPRWFDAIVGNPPYTRQEEIPDTGVDKEKLIESALMLGDKKLADISKRAGIHAYFFVHGTKFLKNNGFFGFVVSNSWLDTEYGKSLQHFFLQNYKILCIIESKVERWFNDADINTCIIILQKCNIEEERNNNLVRFVYLKQKLSQLFIPVQKMWERQLERNDGIEKLVKTIFSHNSFYENQDMRIYPLSQRELYDEGIDQDTNLYEGGKWGKYLRAPDIFFRILEKSKDKLISLRKVAKVETYLNTGGVDGFYFVKGKSQKNRNIIIENVSKEGGKKEFEIERKYLKRFIKSPRELPNIEISKKHAKWLIVVPPSKETINKKDKIFKYINWGESVGFNSRSGSKNRSPWWKLPIQAKRTSKILFSRIHDDRHLVFYNPHKILNTNFYSIWPNNIDEKLFTIVLNSTFFAMLKEILGRVNFGQGALKTEGVDIKNFMFIKPEILTKHSKQLISVFDEISNRPINNIFEELGAKEIKEISLDGIKMDRLKLDLVVLQDILGLTNKEIIEFYKETFDLVKSRIERAASIEKNGYRGKINIDLIKEAIVEKLKNQD